MKIIFIFKQQNEYIVESAEQVEHRRKKALKSMTYVRSTADVFPPKTTERVEQCQYLPVKD